MITKYRCIINHNTNVQNVYPLGINDVTYPSEKEGDNIFLRTKMNGKLTFTNQRGAGIFDYDLMKSIEDGADRCIDVLFLVQSSCDNGVTYSDYYLGRFNISDGEFDLDKCTYTVDVTPNDKYRCFDYNKDYELQLPTVANIETGAMLVTDYEFFTCRAAPGCALPDSSGTWLLFHTETLDGVTTSIYYREIAVVPCQGGISVDPNGSPSPYSNGWKLKINNCLVNGLSYFVRIPVTIVTNNPNPAVQPGNCESGVSSPPPRKQTLTITKQTGTPTPTILGYTQTGQNGALCVTYYFRVRNNPGSTYAWSITAGATTIVGSSTSHVVELAVNGSFTIAVTETTACGASATATQAVTNVPGGGVVFLNNQTLKRNTVCPGSVSRFTTNIVTGGAAIISADTGGGASLTSSVIDGLTVYELTAGLAGTITIDFTGGSACISPGTTFDFSLLVTEANGSATIDGMSTVCKSGQYKYSVPYSDSVTFVWEVTGGTINSGQGTNEITVTWDGSVGTGYVYLTEQACNCGWIQVSDCTGGASYWWCVAPTTFTKGHLLKDVLQKFITQFGCSVTLKSDFFEWDPVGDAPGYVAGENYVTGLPNKLNYPSLHSMEEVLYDLVSGSEITQNSKVKWSDVVKIILETFQVYWFIDGSSNLRFEHISYFNQVLGIDLTSGIYPDYVSGSLKYHYDKPKMPKYERFKWQNASDTDFIGAEIRYDSSCVDNNPSTNVSLRGANNTTTDLKYINTNKNNISKSGFVLMVNTYSGGNYAVDSEAGVITGITKVNAHLAYANLHSNYWLHDRVVCEGYMNLALTTFETVRRTKIQEDVKFPFCCTDSIDFLFDYLKTELGTKGVVDSAEFSPKDNILKVTLSYIRETC